MVDLGTLGGSYGQATAVNANGQVVGDSFTTGNASTHAFSWTQAGGMVDLGALGGSRSWAFAVSASGQVVGASYLPGDALYHALSWTQAGGMVDLGTLGGYWSQAYAVNASGQVVGDSYTANGEWHAVLWQLTGRGTLQSVLDQIGAAVPSASRKLTDALDPSLWVDDNHLQPQHGILVFMDVSYAVQKLTDLLQDPATTIPAATLHSWIDALVGVCRSLAETAIQAAPPGDPKIAAAQQEMTYAAQDLANGLYADAIVHYKNAWEKAQQAVR